MNINKISITVRSMFIFMIVVLMFMGSAFTATASIGEFRVGPSVTLRPVTDMIKANQDGIVELFMNNPSFNDVTLNVDARISVPSGIHVYGESFGQGAGNGVVAGTFSVPPGISRTIILVIKADKSARIGSHSIMFTGLYWPGDNKDAFQPLSLTYSVNVTEASNNPESAESSTPTPTITPTPQTPVETTKKSSSSVNLHGEKTDVVIGENVLLKLSAINIIGNPIMHVQVIIIPPNGWSVTSSEFSKSGAGQYVTMYDLKPEDGSRDIEVRIMPNQIGDNFEVKGRIIYYFGEDLSTREDHPLNLPIKVRAESKETQNPAVQPPKSPGFEIILASVGMLLALLFRRR